MEYNNQKNYYNKKKIWKWILLYIIIGAAVYGIIYYVISHQNGGNGYNYNATQYQNNYQTTGNNNITTSPSQVNSASTLVTISNFSFNPNILIVHKGTTVTWKNNDSMPHTVTGNNGGPASQNISPGASYSYTFLQTGTFPYYCTIHPSMQATVQVTN